MACLAPRANAEYPCSGPGPGEIIVGMTNGSDGVATEIQTTRIIQHKIILAAVVLVITTQSRRH
jgi:hypothetical protein